MATVVTVLHPVTGLPCPVQILPTVDIPGVLDGQVPAHGAPHTPCAAASVPFDRSDPAAVYAWLLAAMTVLAVRGDPPRLPMESVPGRIY